jgi:catechol O-methyltransferase
MVDDPFVTAFGDDDADEGDNDAIDSEVRPENMPVPVGEIDKEQASIQDENVVANVVERSQEHDVLSFHNGTEQALLIFVQQAVRDYISNTESQNELRNVRQIVIQAIDQFCMERHWMMHVGPEKGRIMQDFLKDHIMKQQQCYQSNAQAIYNVVELGTYCGYSAIRIADTLIRNAQCIPNFHIYTIDVNHQTQNIAKQLIALAGLENYITFILRESTDKNHHSTLSFLDQLMDSMSIRRNDTIIDNTTHENDKRIDFLFVDHAKELYLSDVQQLESSGFIQRGTAIAADNVVFFQLSDYCNYMRSLQALDIVDSKLITDDIYLEYSTVASKGETDYRDGLGTFRVKF